MIHKINPSVDYSQWLLKSKTNHQMARKRGLVHRYRHKYKESSKIKEEDKESSTIKEEDNILVIQ